MADRKHSPTTSSSQECGWKFHSLSPINSSVNGSLSRNPVYDSDDGSKGTEDEPESTCYQQMASEFHRDGFLCLSDVFPSDFVDMLRSETMGLFASCLHHLRENGELEFEQSWRRRRLRRSTEDGDLVPIQKNYSSTPERESRNLEHNSEDSTANEARKSSCTEYDTPYEYQYPLKVGLKHGYQELVMRSPGRYEMALLLDDAVHKSITPNRHSAPGYDHATNDKEELPNHYSGRRFGEKGDYNDKWLMNQNMYENSLRQQSNVGNTRQCTAGVNVTASDSFHQCQGRSRSCLREILDCVKHSENNTTANAHFPDEKRGSGAKLKISYQMQQLLELVRNIYSPSHTNSVPEQTISASSGRFGQGRSAADKPMDNDFYLCNLSLLVATPGCPTQAWHADGGHVSMSTHEPCHCFNVFVPLVDVPLEMGPTELRPGTHYHTRNLAPMMLAAKARKTLQPPVTPRLRKGDALIFDYRILHRGKANLSDTVNAKGDSEGCLDETSREGSDCKDANITDNIFKVGRDRPILVMTFARRWFVDVCNFPKRSVFSL